MVLPPLPGSEPTETSETPFPPPPGDILSEPIMTLPEERSRRRRPKRKRPDPGWILSEATAAEQFWSPRDRRMDLDQSLYELREPNIEGSGELILKNLPFVLVEKMADIFSEWPVVQVYPSDPRLASVAQKIENFCRYLLFLWSERYESQPSNPLMGDLARFLALRGWVAIRLQYDDEAEADEPPVRLFVCDPRQVYPVFGDDGLSYVFHRYHQLYSQVIDRYPEAKKILGERNPTDLVEVIAYYDSDWYCLFVDSQLIRRPVEHGYGFVPWVIRWARGAPYRATATNLQAWTEWVGVGILQAIKPAYFKLNKLLSQLATQVENATNPVVLYYYDPANPEGPAKLSLDPGTVNYLVYDRERIDRLDLSPKITDLQPLIQELREDLELGGLPRALWGVGDLSGFALAMAAAVARQSLSSYTTALQRTIEDVLKLSLRLVADLSDRPVGYFVFDRVQRVWRSGEPIDPNEIANAVGRIQARFRDILPRDRIAIGQLAIALTREKLVSLETAREEYLGIENPDLENERILAEQIFLDRDVMQKALVPAALQKVAPELWELYQWHREQERASEPPKPPSEPSPEPGLMHPSVLPFPLQTPPDGQPFDLLSQVAAGEAGAAGVEAPVGTPGPAAIPVESVLPPLIR